MRKLLCILSFTCAAQAAAQPHYLRTQSANCTTPSAACAVDTLSATLVQTRGATTLTLRSSVADGASAVAITIDTSVALANAGSKILSVKNNANEKSWIDLDGAYITPAGTGFIGNGARAYGGDFFLSGNSSNSGTAQATKIGNLAALTDTGNRMLGIYQDNMVTRIFSVFSSGGTRQDVAATLPTCNAANERREEWDAAAGGTSGAISRKCFCSSDGAGTPVYTWRNLTSGTNGTATTCAP